jgi:hypothetical protein
VTGVLRVFAGRLRPDVGGERLWDGSFGWFVVPPRTDSCVQAAFATCLEVAFADVPDPRLDERVAAGEDVAEIDRSAAREMGAWLAARGLRMVVHRPPPVHLPRWIGIVELPGVHQNHCLVFARDRLLSDPSVDWFRAQERFVRPPMLAGFGDAVGDLVDPPQVRVWGLQDVSYGLSFEKNDEVRRT